MITKMIAVKTIIGIFVVIMTAGVLLFETEITNFVNNKVSDAVDTGLQPITKDVPEAQTIKQLGNTADTAKTYQEDTHTVNLAVAKKTMTLDMTFGIPVMVVIGAVATILAKLGFKI